MSKLSPEVLVQKLAEAREKVTPGATYKHYKNLTYTVLDVALLETTNEPCVIYQATYDKNLVWVRSISDWLQKVEWNGEQVDRFMLVSTD